jgi:hypothetical protein
LCATFSDARDLVRSRAALEIEVIARHQLTVLQRSVKRPKLTPGGSVSVGAAGGTLARLAFRARHR